MKIISINSVHMFICATNEFLTKMDECNKRPHNEFTWAGKYVELLMLY